MKNRKIHSLQRDIFFALIAFIVFVSIHGCARHGNLADSEGSLAEVEIMSSGNLSKIGGEEGSRTIFISIHDHTGKLLALPEDARGTLAGKGLSLADSPSNAAWILQVSVLGEGGASRENFLTTISNGYGKPVKLAGQGITGAVADALLVKRRVPSARRPSQARLKNIGQTNALASSQMRMGLFVPHETPRHAALPDYFSRMLCLELARQLGGRE